MSKSIVIGAGAGIGRANGGGGYNTGGPQGGGNKKQGLVGTTNRRVELVPYVRTRADGGNSRNWVFCMNQLGGVGRRWGQAAGPGNRGGVHAGCKALAEEIRNRYPARLPQGSGYGTPSTFRHKPFGLAGGVGQGAAGRGPSYPACKTLGCSSVMVTMVPATMRALGYPGPSAVQTEVPGRILTSLENRELTTLLQRGGVPDGWGTVVGAIAVQLTSLPIGAPAYLQPLKASSSQGARIIVWALIDAGIYSSDRYRNIALVTNTEFNDVVRAFRATSTGHEEQLRSWLVHEDREAAPLHFYFSPHDHGSPTASVIATPRKPPSSAAAMPKQLLGGTELVAKSMIGMYLQDDAFAWDPSSVQKSAMAIDATASEMADAGCDTLIIASIVFGGVNAVDFNQLYSLLKKLTDIQWDTSYIHSDVLRHRMVNLNADAKEGSDEKQHIDGILYSLGKTMGYSAFGGTGDASTWAKTLSQLAFDHWNELTLYPASPGPRKGWMAEIKRRVLSVGGANYGGWEILGPSLSGVSGPTPTKSAGCPCTAASQCKAGTAMQSYYTMYNADGGPGLSDEWSQREGEEGKSLPELRKQVINLSSDRQGEGDCTADEAKESFREFLNSDCKDFNSCSTPGTNWTSENWGKREVWYSTRTGGGFCYKQPSSRQKYIESNVILASKSDGAPEQALFDAHLTAWTLVVLFRSLAFNGIDWDVEGGMGEGHGLQTNLQVLNAAIADLTGDGGELYIEEDEFYNGLTVLIGEGYQGEYASIINPSKPQVLDRDSATRTAQRNAWVPSTDPSKQTLISPLALKNGGTLDSDVLAKIVYGEEAENKVTSAALEENLRTFYWTYVNFMLYGISLYSCKCEDTSTACFGSCNSLGWAKAAGSLVKNDKIGFDGGAVQNELTPCCMATESDADGKAAGKILTKSLFDGITSERLSFTVTVDAAAIGTCATCEDLNDEAASNYAGIDFTKAMKEIYSEYEIGGFLVWWAPGGHAPCGSAKAALCQTLPTLTGSPTAERLAGWCKAQEVAPKAPSYELPYVLAGVPECGGASPPSGGGGGGGDDRKCDPIKGAWCSTQEDVDLCKQCGGSCTIDSACEGSR